MEKAIVKILSWLLLMVFTVSSISCDEDPKIIVDPNPKIDADSLNPGILDDYSAISDNNFYSRWGSYNLHDPSISKDGEWFHIFSTDVAYGPNGQCGIMHRKSKDLVHWQYLGWVFNGVPPIALEYMEHYQSGYRQESIWAPYIIKVGETFRLYYSVPGNDWMKLAAIGLATSATLDGPWTDEGIIISCLPEDHYNAIDPAVIVDRENGKHWFSYGSYSSGIYIVELDAATGKRKDANDTGHLLAYREKNHDAIEGAEIIYNDETEMYYLFVSYDWLEDNYNVRVGRSDKPEGPYLDINGNDFSAIGDNLPMITAQYQFLYHSGWQGVGHCGLLKEGDQYYFVSQARLGNNIFIMDLHLRKMVWSPDGWPMVSPERYANVPQPVIESEMIAGEWEHIELKLITSKNISRGIMLNAEGAIEGKPDASWSWVNEIFTLNMGGGETYECRILSEWDWEKDKLTLVYTGMDSAGNCIWGKKK